MSANHAHGQVLTWGLLLNATFTVVEFLVGIATGSLALIADAAHNATDTLSLLIALAGEAVGKRRASKNRTYGYGRVTIMSAFINAMLLVAVSAYIFVEAYQRLQHPEPVAGGVVASVAVLGLIINGSIASLFAKEKSDLNLRAAYLHMLSDALASLGALVAGLLVLLTGSPLADPLISALIGLLVLRGAFEILYRTLNVFLEGVPEGVDTLKVAAAIETVPEVRGIHDLHIWALSSRDAALSCHIVLNVQTLEQAAPVVAEVKAQLEKHFGISHATIESELVHCEPEPNA